MICSDQLCPHIYYPFGLYFQVKTALTPLGHIRLSRKKISRSHPDDFACARDGAARDGQINPLCTLAPVPTAKSGVETPQRVFGTAPSHTKCKLIPDTYYNETNEDNAYWYYYNILF